MQELVKHIVSNNKQIQKQLKIVDIEQYTQQNQEVYKQLDVDIKRGLLRFKSLLFNENYSESFYTQQQIFQQYFLLLWVNFPKSLQQSYYQGFTDIFETMFISLVSTDKIVCDQTFIVFVQLYSDSERDFELFYAGREQKQIQIYLWFLRAGRAQDLEISSTF
ncbi:Conserved_hypothetical protein [Hexamita inflata]|uniref:Uncharacterized protein n=1 Tax=Hexamita inflata TaxID=28002 RepID=A0AA86PH39_9EUKA|nr:Conserved hypothetical protein [Hexamita inflata]